MVGEDYAGDPQHPLVARANTFISHAWKHKFRDTAEAVLSFAADWKGGEPLYFWFDIMVLDYNFIDIHPDKPANFFDTIFDTTIK